jgi:hypothetical protein
MEVDWILIDEQFPAMELSGTRIPTVVFFLNSLGKLLLPGKIIYGPVRLF